MFLLAPDVVADGAAVPSAASLVADFRKAPKYVPITDYAYDCHTAAGRKKGRTKEQFSGTSSGR